MRRIPLTRGKFAIVDSSDCKWLSKWKWRATRPTPTGIERWYAAHTIGPNGKTIYMHRLIMLGIRPSGRKLCDHRDGNGLNNQRNNLRLCSAAQNVQNRRKEPGLSSRFKGVYWHRRDQRWVSRLVHRRQSRFLGKFRDEQAAAVAYDVAARSQFGKFARLNFPCP